MENESNRKLFPEERRQQIRTLVGENGRVSVDELTMRFDVSSVTIRTDLGRLEREGVVKRTHGGAIALASDDSRADPSFGERELLNQNEKARIGEAAAALVSDGSTILLDASTTTLQMAKHIRQRRAVTVVTNCLPIAMAFDDAPGITVVILGGIVRPSSWSVVGNWLNQILAEINIDRAFLGCKGITPDEGYSDVNAWIIETKKSMMAVARDSVVLADHGKWGRVAFASFAAIDAVSTIVTDSGVPTDMVKSVQARGVDVVVV